MENESVNDEIKRYREMSEQMAQVGAGANLPAVRQLLTSFYEPLMVGVEREQSMISEGRAWLSIEECTDRIYNY